MSGLWLVPLLCVLAEADGPVDFETEIVPTFTRAGCNAGACHGAATGRGGFRLSLLGGDPALDYESIVYAFEGRRIDRASPERSLLLAKPQAQIDHGGGAVLELESEDSRRLLRWLRAGVPRGSPRRLNRLELHPPRAVVELAQPTLRFAAVAHFDDGRVLDVSHLTHFTTTDPFGVQIDLSNRIATVLRRGRQVILARYLDRVVPLPIDVPLGDEPVDLANEPVANWIDTAIYDQLATLRLPPSPLAEDAVFLRRVSLDLTGRLPTRDRIERYLADRSPDKVVRWVDELLASNAFVEAWTMRLARWLRLHSLPNDSVAVRTYANWIRLQIAESRPIDGMARELLLATGDSHVHGPANFARMVNDARGHAELVGQFFLGARLGCANCHAHPLDRWTQDDYHGLAAVFARVERGREVSLSARGAVTNLRTGEPAIPRIPGERNLPTEGDPRMAFAAWLTSPENRQFPRAIVNRLWQSMFGRGLVEPVDDLRETNPPTHPELLTRLAEDFVRHGYDLRHTLRQIATSRTYARDSQPVAGNVQDDLFYSHAAIRPLPPEVLADLFDDVTGVPSRYPDVALGTRAIELVDPLRPAPALDILGRCSRLAGCDESPTASRGLATHLHLLNGELLNGKIQSPEGHLAQRLTAQRDNADIVTDFYWRGFGRQPTSAELQGWLERLAAGQDPDSRRELLEDFLWSMLSSRELMHNH